MILVVGKPQDALFGVVLVTSALIGIGQELRAKHTLDRLAALSAPRVRVIRDGTQRDIAVADLVPTLGAPADDENRNTTLAAIGHAFPPDGHQPARGARRRRQNDHSLLDACEIGVAVANVIDAIRAHADMVLALPDG